ncbi:MAG: uncharacterized protein QOJ35_1288 [Solirubrobacteraceae bacterium]|nr:uncharacterized protein [Solirubrobacteraceae bacterium]
MSGTSRGRCLAVAAALAVVLAAPASAPAAAPPASGCDVGPLTNFLAADATHEGVISLVFFGAGGGRVEFFECVDRALRPLGTIADAPDAGVTLPDATTWDCARPTRHFVARATRPDGSIVAGSYSVRTGSCAARFELRVPRRVAPGAVGRARIVDRWGIGGVAPRLCISPPRGDRVCQRVRLARAVTIATRRFRARVRGVWRVELRIGAHRVRRSVAVGGDAPAPRAPLRLLATGDSTMQGVDNFLADELAAVATVRSDIRVGTGISKSDWQAIAAAQVRDRPDVTVMSLGVNEGFPLPAPGGGTVDCCEEPWVAAYADRVRAVIRTYLRRGRARVIWCTIALPRTGPRTPITTAVNSAIVRAGAGLAGVTVLRMDLVFSPYGYQDVIRYRGRNVRVRAADGIHLSVSGTAIEARIIAGVVRRR